MNVGRTVLGGLFVVAGALHFVRGEWYEAIVPAYLPAHRLLVQISGAAEIAGGAGVLLPPTRRAAGWGLIALLIAVFPANLNMAVESERFARIAPPWGLWLRLPLQAVLIWWVWAAALRAPQGGEAEP